MLESRLLVTMAFLLGAPALLAQGTGAYFNVESPQRKPITVARVEGHDYLVACNTPDGCIEIYDTHTNGFLLRVQTGAEPISVVYNPNLGKLFTCNFLGDSISVIALAIQQPSGTLVASLERTTVVGDEPNHIAFAPGDQSLFVTLGSQSAMAELSTSTLAPVAPGSERIDLVDNVATATKALKDPCIALVRSNTLYVLGHRAGKTFETNQDDCTEGDPCDETPFGEYDFAIRSIDLTTGTIGQINGLGTLNFGMEFAQNGDLWVVGTEAEFQVIGETALRNHPLGFVHSKIYKFTPSTGALAERDLNASATGAQVSKPETLSQPTDVVLYEPGGVLQKVFVAAFNSDRVGVIDSLSLPAANWTISQIDVPRATGSTNPMSGPRGLAIKYASGLSGDPGSRVYALNRLDNAVSVIDPATNSVVATFALRRDPTPAYVRLGREFLYGAQHSGSGIVSCASCHADGRSDFLRWNLSDNSNQPFPANIKDGIVFEPNGIPTTHWPANKDFLITQTLQGMVNFETLPEVQSYFTNEPLHWRGDRSNFVAFNAAFVNLMGRQTQLSNAEMEDYRDFVFSIAYPPNPEQPSTRTYSGTLGNANDLTTGTGAKRGMKLYHMKALAENPACGGRSCVQCHWLPEGSDNKLTEFVSNQFLFDNRQPMETPGIRLLRQKERRIETGTYASGTVRTGLFGLLHEGSSPSINTFIFNAFQQDLTVSQRNEVTQFVREFDTSVGPMVGQSHTIDVTTAGSSSTTTLFNLVESQAGKANHGIAVQLRTSGGLQGFWYDLTTIPPRYREEPAGLVLTRSGLLALLSQASDLLVLHVTSLGSERRIAWPSSGTPGELQGNAPSNITLEPAVPNTAYQPVPRMTLNWIPVEVVPGAENFDWLGDAQGVATPPAVKAVRLFQWGLLQDGAANEGYGLPELRHEAPRRFRVSMDDGRHGAKLRLEMANDGNPPTQAAQFLVFELPLHPTNQVNEAGRRIWETAVEADPLTLYSLMLGGPHAPNVQATLNGTFQPTEPPSVGSYDPTLWNSYRVKVVNENLTVGDGGWQPIRID